MNAVHLGVPGLRFPASRLAFGFPVAGALAGAEAKGRRGGGIAATAGRLDDPRSLALPNWDALEQLAAALVAHSAGRYPGWGDVVEFTACTAARIGETSGVHRADINSMT